MEKYNKTLIKTGVSSVLLSSGILLGSSFASDLPFSSIEVEAASTTTYTTTANLNLRSTNSTKGKILLTIPKGKLLIISRNLELGTKFHIMEKPVGLVRNILK